MWYPGSGVVLDCIVSWSFAVYLTSNAFSTLKKQSPISFLSLKQVQLNFSCILTILMIHMKIQTI